jgi:hypothetical protein
MPRSASSRESFLLLLLLLMWEMKERTGMQERETTGQREQIALRGKLWS